MRWIGIDVDEVRRRIEDAFGPGALDGPARQSAGAGPIGPVFTSDAKHALELAVRESIRLSHGYIGTEHLLLAVAAADGLSADVLQGLDADPAVVRTRVLDRLGRAA